MSRGRSIATSLHVGEVDDDELTLVLASALPRGAQFVDREVEYRTRDDDLAITVVYCNGRIVDAFAGPALAAVLEEHLDSKIQGELLAAGDRRICRWTMFSGRPVEGVWRYRNELQIVPAPPEATRPDVVMADHPFVLDFVFEGSPNGRVQQLRYGRKAHELTLLLDLLLVSGISTTTNRPQHRWAFLPWDPTLESQPEVAWLQDGYFIPGFTYLVESLPTDASTPMAEVEADRYYDPRDFDARSDVLTVPSQLEALLDCFYGLEGEKRERLLMACYWHHMAKSLWHQSQSLHLTSLINAVECLASAGRDPEDPEGPTKLFKTFMREHAPGSPSGTKLDRLYDTRSHITHGERLLHYDRPPGGFGFTQQSATDRQAVDDALILSRGALLNWLWAERHATAEHLITRGLREEPPTPPGTKAAFTVITPDTPGRAS